MGNLENHKNEVPKPKVAPEPKVAPGGSPASDKAGDLLDSLFTNMPGAKRDLETLNVEFNNLEADIISAICAKDTGETFDAVAKQVEESISADQVLSVLIARFGSENASEAEVNAQFKAQFASIHAQYEKSLNTIRQDLHDYSRAVTDSKTRERYSKLFQDINGQGALKEGVLSQAVTAGGAKLRQELEAMIARAFENPTDTQESLRAKEGARMEEFADKDNAELKSNFEQLVTRLNAFEQIILKYDIERTGVANQPKVERKFRADNLLLALWNAMLKAEKMDPNIYKKMGPFLSDVETLVNNAAADIGRLPTSGKKAERLAELDMQISKKFGYIQGLKMTELSRVRFDNTDDAFDVGVEFEENGPEQDFRDKLDAMRNDPNNCCVKHFLDTHQLIDLEGYRAQTNYPRCQSIRSVEITLAYRELYDLCKENQPYAEKYFGGGSQSRQFYNILDNNFKDARVELKDQVYPYFMCVMNKQIHINTSAYNLSGEGIRDADFISLKSMPEGVLEYDSDAGIVYFVNDDGPTIQKHPLILVSGIDEARRMIAQYGKTERGFLQQLTATLQAVGGVFGAASGVVNNVDKFAQDLIKVAGKTPAQRLAEANPAQETQRSIDEVLNLTMELNALNAEREKVNQDITDIEQIVSDYAHNNNYILLRQKRIDLGTKIANKLAEIDAARSHQQTIGSGGSGGQYGGGYGGGNGGDIGGGKYGGGNGGDIGGGNYGVGNGGDIGGNSGSKSGASESRNSGGKEKDSDNPELEAAFQKAIAEKTQGDPKLIAYVKEIMDKLEPEDLQKFKEAVVGILKGEAQNAFKKKLFEKYGIKLA